MSGSGAASRRSKLDSIDPSHLMLVARDAIFHEGENVTPAFVKRVLESAASRRHEEAQRVLSWFGQKKVPCPDRSDMVALDWLGRYLEEEELERDPLALYYRGRCLIMGAHLIKKSAEMGFFPAMSALCRRLDASKGLEWAKKAAEQNDPEGLYELACLEEGFSEHRLNLFWAAAARGHAFAMCRLVEFFPDRIGPLWTATLQGRFNLLSGRANCGFISGPVERLERGELCDDDVQIMFNFGRELEGYDTFWDAGRVPQAPGLICIEIFLLASHRARRGALHTLMVLHSLGVVRDVCQVIAKMVFSSRLCAEIWFSRTEKIPSVCADLLAAERAMTD